MNPPLRVAILLIPGCGLKGSTGLDFVIGGDVTLFSEVCEETLPAEIVLVSGVAPV